MRKIVLSSQALIFMDVSQVQGLSFKLIWLFRKEPVLIADFLPLPDPASLRPRAQDAPTRGVSALPPKSLGVPGGPAANSSL